MTNGADENTNPERTPGAPSTSADSANEAAKKRNFLMAAARYIAVASTLPGAIIAGYGIGYALDYWFHTTYLKIVFLVLGIVAGFMDLIRQLMKDMRKPR